MIWINILRAFLPIRQPFRTRFARGTSTAGSVGRTTTLPPRVRPKRRPCLVSPSATMLFLSRRFSRVRSATASLRAAASTRRSFTSGLLSSGKRSTGSFSDPPQTWRAVSPARDDAAAVPTPPPRSLPRRPASRGPPDAPRGASRRPAGASRRTAARHSRPPPRAPATPSPPPASRPRSTGGGARPRPESPPHRHLQSIWTSLKTSSETSHRRSETHPAGGLERPVTE